MTRLFKLRPLVEFFYNCPASNHVERFVHGSELLMRSIKNKKRGRPHGVRTNALIASRYGVADALGLWGKILVFEALIGNTDRHPDNWGIVWRYTEGVLPAVSLAPAYDHGTSLGYECPEGQITTRWSDDKLARYVLKGMHHCGWSPADDRRGQHFSLCKRFLGAYPQAGEAMRNVVRFDSNNIRRIADEYVSIRGAQPLTDARAQFVCDLVRVRQAMLVEALGA